MRKTYFYSDKSRKTNKNRNILYFMRFFQLFSLPLRRKGNKITPMTHNKNFTLTISKIKS